MAMVFYKTESIPALIIDQTQALLEGFTRGENITLTTSIVYHYHTPHCIQRM